MIGPDGQENIPHREWMLAYDRAITEVKEEFAQQGGADEFIGSEMSLS